MITAYHRSATSAAASGRRNSGRTSTALRGIALTDRIYACLTLKGTVLAEFTADRFLSLSSIMTAIRAMVPWAAGLAKLTIRNMTRGWSLNRPMMLYSESAEPAPAHYMI